MEPEPQALRPIAGETILGTDSNQPQASEGTQPGKRGVAGNREVHDEPLQATVLRHERDARVHRGQGAACGEPMPGDLHVAGVGAVDPEDCARHLTAAGAHETGESNDLARLAPGS